MTILSLQSYHVWNYYKEKVREEEEILAELDKLANKLILSHSNPLLFVYGDPLWGIGHR